MIKSGFVEKKVSKKLVSIKYSTIIILSAISGYLIGLI